MMDRRAFLAGTGAVLLAGPLATEAQQAGKVYRIGWLGFLPTPIARGSFIEGMRKLGWVEGRDFVLEERFTGTNTERATVLATELIRLKADVLVTFGTGTALQAKRVSNTIPIVMLTSGYPVEAGLVASLARPEGNVTGMSIYAGHELFGKYLQLLKELLPTIRRAGVLWDYGPPVGTEEETNLALEEMRRGASALGIALRPWKIQSPEDLDRALATLSSERIDALFVTGGPVHAHRASRISEFAVKRRLSTMTNFKFVYAGGLMAYTADLADLAQRAAYFVDRILKGAKPGDLPIEQPTKFELVINLKTARALGLTIPPSLLMRADEVIE